MTPSAEPLSVFARLLVQAYRFVSAYPRPFLQLHLWRRQFSPGKEHNDPLRRAERWGILPQNLPSLAPVQLQAQTRLWFHTASVGESLSIIPLLRNLRSQATAESLQIIVTCCTVTADDILRRRLCDLGIDHVFAPIDHPEAVSRFLDSWKPTGAVWVESELWPNMILETSSRNIPMVLINGRMSDKSFQRWTSNSIFSEIASHLLSHFKAVICQSASDRYKFSYFCVEPSYYGNLKYAKPSLSSPDYLKSIELQKLISNRSVWLAASTHELEENVILSTHIQLQKTFPDLLTIIAPRHPERAPFIHDKSEIVHISSLSRSSGQALHPYTQLYIVDTIGEMLSLYEALDIVLMGGSLFPCYGGHNPIEPSFMRCIVLHGLYVSNFSEIYASMGDHFMQVSDESELVSKVGRLLEMKKKDSEAVKLIQNATHQAISSREDPCRKVTESLCIHFTIPMNV